MAPQKGKIGTKGAKQIVEENQSTLLFYRNMAMISNAISLLILIFYNSTISIVLYFFSCAVYIGAYQFMVYMARPTYSKRGSCWIAELTLTWKEVLQSRHVKDIIILTAGCQVLSSVISNYFWLLWLLAPLRGFWMLWKNVLGPYFFQPAPAEPEMSEKKQKKLERRMKRQQH